MYPTAQLKDSEELLNYPKIIQTTEIEENYPLTIPVISMRRPGGLVPSHEMVIGYPGREKNIGFFFIKLIEYLYCDKYNFIGAVRTFYYTLYVGAK